jgi:hypothetical protein
MNSRVGSVLGDFHLLDGLPQRSTVTLDNRTKSERNINIPRSHHQFSYSRTATHGSVFSGNSDLFGALGHL